MTDTLPSERARKYRELAESADKQAAAASPDMASAYRGVAEQWRKLAQFVEQVAPGHHIDGARPDKDVPGLRDG